MEKVNKRNHNGVKNSADMYRTFGGEPYPHWSSDFTPDLIKAYRRAGVRCRQAAGELFVHEADQAKAHEVDRTPTPAKDTSQ